MNRLMSSLFFTFLMVCSLKAGSREYFSEHSKDFGVTPRGPVLTHYFFITNTSSQTVSIGQARVSCGCVSANVMKGVLAPGESTAVAAHMDTRRIQFSNVTKTVTVFVPFLTPVFEEVQLKVNAIARDDLSMFPASLEMGTTKLGVGAKVSSKVTFNSDSNWTVQEAKCTGGFVNTEIKEVSRNGSQVTYEITANLDKNCPVGNWQAEVWLTTSNAGVQRIRLPLSVNVEQVIAVNPDTVRLSSMVTGQKTEHRIQLKSDKPFKVTDIKGTDADITVETQEKEATIIQTLKVTVLPAKAGNFEKMLEITTDHPLQKNLSIPVKGAVIK